MTISTFFMYLISGKWNIFEREIIFETISQNPMRNLPFQKTRGVGRVDEREASP